MSFLFVLCFNSFYLKQDSLCLISYLLLKSCFHASVPFYHAFMHVHLSFMLSCECLLLFGCLVFILFFFPKKKKKSEKYKNNVFVYVGTCVLWMAIETKFFKLYNFYNLDKHFYAQLSKWALWLLFVMNKIKLFLVLNTCITLFYGKD